MPNKLDDGQVPTSQQASTSAQPLAVASSPGLRAQQDESDRERVSVNTTLIPKDRRIPFYRRKGANRSSTSEGALSSTSDPSLIKHRANQSGVDVSPSRARPSFLSRVVQKIVPCVNPESGLTPSVEVIMTPEAHRELPGDAGNTTVEMQQIKTDAPTIASVDLDSLSLIITPPSPHSIAPSADSEIIVTPPVSAHLLPEDETDGVTSGAVQPPGSTGSVAVDIARAHSHDTSSSADESDGATCTDDEADDRHMHLEQDEEDRLIRNGGSGIPIGPVR